MPAADPDRPHSGGPASGKVTPGIRRTQEQDGQIRLMLNKRDPVKSAWIQ